MSLVYQSAANTTAFLAAGSSGFILQTNGTGSAPTWVSSAGIGAGSATNSDAIRTIERTTAASHFLTFVDSNNATNAYESLYTTSSFVINPQSGNVGIGTSSPGARLDVRPGTNNIAQILSAGHSTLSGLGAALTFSRGNDGVNDLAAVFSWNNGGLALAGREGLAFATGGGSLYTATVERMRIDSSGNLLVGTTALTGGANGLVQIRGNLSLTAASAVDGGFQQLDFAAGVYTKAAIRGISRGTTDAADLAFLTAPAGDLIQERMRITTAGNVGINTTAPTQRLDVNGGIAVTGVTELSLQRPVIPSFAGQGAPAIQWKFYSTGTTYTAGAMIQGLADAVWSSTSAPTSLRFYTVPTGSTTLSERLCITPAGGIAFGGATNFGSAGQILQSNGDAPPTWVPVSGTTVGTSTQVQTVLRTTNASHFLTFVDSNNAAAAAESLYTSGTVVFNPGLGYVGIGQNNPQTLLHLSGINQSIFLDNMGVESNGLRLRYQTNSAHGANFLYNPNNAVAFIENTYATVSGQVYGDIYFTQNVAGTQTTRMTIKADGGNVGIGTSSPSAKLQLGGQTGPVATPLALQFSNDYSSGSTATGCKIFLFNTGGTEVYGIGVGPASDIQYHAGGTGNTAGKHIWYVANSEKLRITTNGALAFSGSTNYGSAGQMLQSNGDAAPTWVALSGRTVGTSTQVTTVARTTNASHFLTFVDSNNASATAETVYTTSSFSINPQNGNVSIGGRTEGIWLGDTGDNSAYDNVKIYYTGFNGGAPQVIFQPRTTPGSGVLATAFYFKNSNGSSFASNNRADVYVDGNVGIGTVSPSGKLHLYQNAGGSNQLTLDTNFASGNTYAINPFITGVSNGGFSIRDVTNAVERLVIQYSTGNVGIGTTAPDSKLHVEVVNATAYTPVNTLVSGQTARISNTDGTSGVSANLLFVAKGAGGGNGLGSISGVNTGVGSLAFTFGTRHASSNVTERMRITSDGNVVIGAATTLNKFEVAGAAGQLFSVSDSFTGTIFSVNDVSGIPSIEVLDTGLVKFAQYNGAVTIGTGTVSSSTAELSVYGMLYTSGPQGEIRASNEITAYFSSDARLKENIKLIENPITIIDQIRGVTFDWTDEHMARRGGEDGYFVRKHDIGVIAQEVQAVLPELVGTREDGYLAVKYEKLVPLLIEAIKSQQKTIDTLVKDLTDIKEFINNLKNKNGI
jgi:hypothetical protein